MAVNDVNPISIIIPAFNEVAYCRQCIASLERRTRRAYRLILVDNGSTDGVSEFFDSVEGAVVIHAGENLGFAGGVNRGLEMAAGHAVLLNSDTLLTEGWLERLEAALLSADDIGMVGPVSNCAAGPQQLDGLSLADEEEANTFAQERAREKSGAVRHVTRLVGFCLMIRDTVWHEVGTFDERFAIGNYEDDDYCTRVRRAGYRLAVAEDTFIYHFGGRTFAGMGLEGAAFTELMAENRQRYMDKWKVRLPDPPSAENRAKRLNDRARAALAEGDTGEAMRLLKAAVETCPEAPGNYNDLGALLWRLGKEDAAYGLFLEALRRDPAHAEARTNAAEAAAALRLKDGRD